MPSPNFANGELLNGCHSLIPGITPIYDYKPSLAAGIIFVIVFFICFTTNLLRSIQFVRRPASWLLFICSLLEFIGWAARTWSSKCPYNKTAFLINITTLVFSPLFIAAAIYLVLGYLIARRGPQYSLLKPRFYIWLFCGCDVVSLLVQVGGAGIASKETNEHKDTAPGSHLMVAGIIFQLLTMTIFALLGLLFLFRSRKIITSKKEKRLVLTTALAFFCVYIRSVYRTVELLQGWHGYLISHEPYFVVLDGTMMAVALLAFTFFNPDLLLRDTGEDVGAVELRSSRGGVDRGVVGEGNAMGREK